METRGIVIDSTMVMDLNRMGRLFSFFAELGLPATAEIATRLSEEFVGGFELRDLNLLAGYILFQAQAMKIGIVGHVAAGDDPLFTSSALRMYGGKFQLGLSHVRPSDFGRIAGYFSARRTRNDLIEIAPSARDLRPRWAELVHFTNRLLENSMQEASDGNVQIVMNYSPALAVLGRSIVQYSGAPLGSIRMADKLIAEDMKSLV